MREHLLSPVELSRIKVVAAADKIRGTLNCFGAGGSGYPSEQTEVLGFVNVLHGHVREIVQHDLSSEIVDPEAELDGLQQLIYETIGPVAPLARIVHPPAEPVCMADWAVSAGNAEFDPTRLAAAVHGDNGMYVYYETCDRGVVLLDQMTWRSQKTAPDLVTYARSRQRQDVPLGFADFGNGQVVVLTDTTPSAVCQTWMKDFCSGLGDLAQAVSPVTTF